MAIAIIHSHELNDHAEPGKEYLPRLIQGADAVSQGRVEKIILTGGKATRGIDKRHGDAGKKYLISQGLDPNSIYIESDPHGSLETAGETIFARKDHGDSLILPADKVILISSDYHEKRILAIHRAIFGDMVASKMEFLGIPGFQRVQGAEATPGLEAASLEAFYRTFDGVNLHDLQDTMRALWANHGLYKNHPSNPYIQK